MSIANPTVPVGPAAAVRACLGLLLLAAVPAAAQNAGAVCPEGRELYQAARFAEARAALEECLAGGAESVEVLLPLAVMGVREGRLDEGRDYARRAVELAPEDTEARYWYGRALLRSDRVEAAREQWEAGLAVAVDHPGILEGLARLALSDGDAPKAYNLLRQLQLQGVDDAWLHVLLAEIAAGKAMWPQALAHLQDAFVRKDPTADDLVFGTELALLSGRREEALRYGRRAVALQPGGTTHGNLGKTYFALEEVDSAIVHFRLALTDPEADPRLRFNLANALEIAGQPAEAGEHFRAFLEQQPDDAMGHFNYGVHLDKQGRREEALVEIDRAIALADDLLQARVVKVQLLETEARYDEALAVLAELQQRDEQAQAELATWRQRLVRARDAARAAAEEGKIHLLHMVLPDRSVLERVQAELERGEEFTQLATRFSSGPAAARGGDIGWVQPDEMRPALAAAVRDLAVGEISSPVDAGGLIHLFQRIP